MSERYAQHAWLYDAAFDWDVTEEVAWLCERLGGRPRSLLEPACGSGRILAAFARRGVEVFGVDLSPTMLERARERFAREGIAPPHLVLGDMCALEDVPFPDDIDGAVLPVGTFGYLLTEDQARSHLAGVAARLRPGARYLVQLELSDLASYGPCEPNETTRWDTPRAEGTIRTTVFGRAWDPEKRWEETVTRYEILDGPSAGEVHESVRPMRIWDWASWDSLVRTSGFRQVGAWNGNARGRPALSLGPCLEGELLTWHALERS